MPDLDKTIKDKFAEVTRLRETLDATMTKIKPLHDEVGRLVSRRHIARLNDLTPPAYLAALLLTRDDETGIEFDRTLYDRRAREVAALGPFRCSGYNQKTGLSVVTIDVADPNRVKDDALWIALPAQLEPILAAYRAKTPTFRIDVTRPDLSAGGITHLEVDGARYRHKTIVYNHETTRFESDALPEVLADIRRSLRSMIGR